MERGRTSEGNGFFKVFISFLISCMTSSEVLSNFGHQFLALKDDGIELVDPLFYLCLGLNCASFFKKKNYLYC